MQRVKKAHIQRLYTRARWFGVSQTYDSELGPITIPEWDAERALAALCIERIPFDKRAETVMGLQGAVRSRSIPWRNSRIRHFFTKRPTYVASNLCGAEPTSVRGSIHPHLTRLW